MADRTVYGLTNSENGWRMVDQGSCVWVTVPGTKVTLQIREGQPAKILGAFVADWNAYIEPVRDADSACWTATNSVASSNHLSGTACDVDWNSHPFKVADAGFNAAQLATMREMLKFYEDMVFWGNDWNSPKDAMHVQMGYDTYGSENVDRVQDFINRKVRADGFSTFRRTGTVPPPVVVPPTLSRADGYAVKIIAEGQRLGITPRGIKIALSVALVETNLTMYANSNDPPSLNFPHDGVGSDHMSSGLFQQQTSWGSLADRMDATKSANIFFTVDHGPGVRGLTKIRKRINGRDGDLWDYNDTSRSPGFYAQTVQGSAFPDRYDERYADAEKLYNRLAGTTTPTQEDDMAQVPQDQWDRVYRELTQKLPSRSPLRHLGEGLVDTVAGFVLNVDGSEHVGIVKLLAGYGHPPTLALLREVAGADPGQYPDRQDDAKLAQAILAEVTSTPAVARVAAAPEVVYLPAPEAAATAPVSGDSTGAIIGRAYDALEALQLSGALTDTEKAPLAALIGVLQTKTQGAA